MTHDDVRGWIDAYVEAIGDLFAEDATYAYYPYDEGRGAVVQVPSGGSHGTPARGPPVRDPSGRERGHRTAGPGPSARAD